MAGATPIFREFPTRAALAAALSASIASRLGSAIGRNGRATLAVSGGTTPALFFKALSTVDLDWPKVTVTLVDERFVAESSPRSNAGLARANLLVDKAASAKFVGLYSRAATVEDAARETAMAIEAIGVPLDAVVLGMGGDGHTASFFPDAPTLASLLDPANPALVVPVHAASGIEARLTLTMPLIAGADKVIVHVEGAEKRQVMDAVLAGADLPIRHVLDHARNPVEIYWAP